MAGRLRWLNKFTPLFFDQATNTMGPANTSGGSIIVVPSSLSGIVGYQQIVGLAAATALTVPAGGVSQVSIIPENQGVRWRGDGVNPTATVGQPLYPGQELIITNRLNVTVGPIYDLLFIQMAVTATLNITYFQ